MVWFYLLTLFGTFTGSKSFQSHYGLILSIHCYQNWLHVKALSIPLWSDFILSLMAARIAGRSLSLSIPLWSDFIFQIFYYFDYNAETFQSHYGLILSRPVSCNVNNLWIAFNPTMVWFYHSYNNYHCNRCSNLSIPLWSDFIRYQIRRFHNSRILSIPLWSDFIWYRLL